MTSRSRNSKNRSARPDTLLLIDLIIDNSNPQELVQDFFPGDDLFTPATRRKGLPMGNLTSQFFANIYLSPFDHFIREELGIPAYLRYVDDFVLFAADKDRLHRAKEAIRDYLARELRLLLHPRKCEVSPVRDGITFLGQRIFLTHRRLRRENVQRLRRRLRVCVHQYHAGKLNPEKLECQLNSWLGHARQADTWRLRRRILRDLRGKGLNLLETPKRAWVLL